MGIFEKKLDIMKDRLRTVFNPNTQKYEIYIGNNLIEYKKLNEKSKKYINSKNNQLQTNPYILKLELEMAKTKKRFEKLKSLGYICDCFETLGNANGTMSKEIETLLNSLVSEENILLGIHRIGPDDSFDKIQDILINGLKITGHLDGAAQSTKTLKHNVSYYPNNKTIIKELMYADLYKDSKGSILIRIPDDDLNKNIFIIDNEGITRLNPKYIIGYIPLEENHHIGQIIQIKPNHIKNTYTYENNTNNRPTSVYENNENSKIRR